MGPWLTLAATPALGSSRSWLLACINLRCHIKLHIELWKNHLPDAADLSMATVPVGPKVANAQEDPLKPPSPAHRSAASVWGEQKPCECRSICTSIGNIPEGGLLLGIVSINGETESV